MLDKVHSCSELMSLQLEFYSCYWKWCVAPLVTSTFYSHHRNRHQLSFPSSLLAIDWILTRQSFLWSCVEIRTHRNLEFEPAPSKTPTCLLLMTVCSIHLRSVTAELSWCRGKEASKIEVVRFHSVLISCFSPAPLNRGLYIGRNLCIYIYL